MGKNIIEPPQDGGSFRRSIIEKGKMPPPGDPGSGDMLLLALCLYFSILFFAACPHCPHLDIVLDVLFVIKAASNSS
jgi:hypothetical protein